MRSSTVAFAALFFFSVVSGVRGDQSIDDAPRIDATVSRHQVDIADPFTLTLTVTASDKMNIQFPDVGETLGPFEIISYRDQFDVPAAKSTRRSTRTVELETLQTGELKIPAIDVLWKSQVPASTQWQRAASDAIPIYVVSTLESETDPNEFQDIRGLIDAPQPVSHGYAWLGWSLAVIATLFAVGVLVAIFLIRRARRWQTPQQWALQSLNDLQNTSVDQLDHILRFYLQQEFGFAAATLTANQIEVELAKRSVPAEHAQAVIDFFGRAQQVRFAGRPIAKDQLEQWRQEIVTTVQQLSSLPVGLS